MRILLDATFRKKTAEPAQHLSIRRMNRFLIFVHYFESYWFICHIDISKRALFERRIVDKKLNV